jgi:Putative prokaryotic signal transducing protein
MGGGDVEGLVCPSCDTPHAASERFCERCGMPLVHPGGGEVDASETRRRARKIKPQYAEGELVSVARASSEAEAEFIAGLLLEEGIPSVIRRSAGFDVAEFLAAGPRDVLVPQSGAQAASEALRPGPG